MADFLFVYGTLRSEFDNPHARKLRAEALLIGRATVMGSIFRIGPYPGYRPDPPGEVLGELYRLATPAATLKALDGYEGSEFRRITTRVSTGETAWIYQIKAQPPVSERIVSGDFCAE